MEQQGDWFAFQLSRDELLSEFRDVLEVDESEKSATVTNDELGRALAMFYRNDDY